MTWGHCDPLGYALVPASAPSHRGRRRYATGPCVPALDPTLVTCEEYVLRRQEEEPESESRCSGKSGALVRHHPISDATVATRYAC